MEEKIVTLVVLSFEKAHILKTMLEVEGISSFLENANLIQGAVSQGVKVKIEESSLEKAMEVLESMMHEEFAMPDSPPVPPRILLPVDFSSYSNKAADIAFDWANVLRAELMVMHTYFNPIISTMPFSDTFAYEMNMEELVVELEDKAKDGMEKMLAYLNEKNDKLGSNKLVIKSELIKGIAEDEIVKYSKQYQPSVVIMGTRGKDQKVADLIGSVTAEVMERSKSPVFAVPEDFNYQGIDSLKHLSYATDFMDGDFKAIEILEKIVKPLGVTIICAHVSSKNSSQWDAVRLQGLKEHFKKYYDEKNVDSYLIEHEDFYLGLESYVHEQGVDVLSFTRRKRGLISKLVNPNIAKKMLFHSTTPLLVFND
ncbi:universal stress protein [Carboxylicivirga sp. N1Y90]|uniref:universal stress protein n=1 Tax=Carboxylicivirga fragile TaxID=3417571 RepID=UPI003D33B46F|nr:universal stress protein [Marinilabiliaceae bacterium N1Y90]